MRVVREGWWVGGGGCGGGARRRTLRHRSSLQPHRLSGAQAAARCLVSAGAAAARVRSRVHDPVVDLDASTATNCTCRWYIQNHNKVIELFFILPDLSVAKSAEISADRNTAWPVECTSCANRRPSAPAIRPAMNGRRGEGGAV